MTAVPRRPIRVDLPSEGRDTGYPPRPLTAREKMHRLRRLRNRGYMQLERERRRRNRDRDADAAYLDRRVAALMAAMENYGTKTDSEKVNWLKEGF